MIKKDLVFFLGYSLILLSCGNNASNSKLDGLKSFNILDSLKISRNLGDIVEREFKGSIYSVSYCNIECTLLLYNRLNSGDGVYKFTQRYIDTENGNDLISTTYGRQYTLRGDAVNKDAVVYQLVQFASYKTMNLLYINGDLELLNEKFERYESGNHIFTLVRKFSKTDAIY